MKKNSLNNNKEKLRNSDSSLEANFTLNNTDDDIELKEIIEAPSFLGLFRFTTKWEKFLLIIGFISAIASGAIQPLSNILIGDLTQVLVTYSTKCVILANPCDATDRENLSNGVRLFAIWNSVIGIAMLITAYIGTETFSYIAVKQVFRVRSAYLNKLFNKDIPWFDVHNSGDFASRMTDDLSKFEEGIGEKIPLFVTLQGTFFAAIILALKKGWKLALICLVSLPVSIIVIGFIAFLTTKFSAKELDAYGNAGSIAEEVLTSIRTVIAFGGEKLEKERYDKGLIRAKNNNIRRHFFEASGFGSIWLCIYGSYGFAFWYGIKLMLEGDSTYTPGNMITIFFSVMAGNMSFGIASPFIEAFAQAKAAGGKIFHIIDEKPVINRSKNIGKKLEFIKGNIELQNLKFQYPSRKEVAILNSLSLTIKAGETVALVGSSGCGKSTVLQLVQRFYDPLEGNILVDGHDIKDLNLTFYRQNIGVVSQEPVLFGTTIGENIRFGNKDAKTEDIISAAKMANAHYFIKGLPNGYDTLVGERGAQLSGGQKQRIAIARALIRNPAILLLDEATSALDTNSEAKVQAALDKASQNRTTIIVAHRLSTIRGANKIVVISNGKVVEQGSHVELMNLGKEYYNLVTTQVQSSEEFLNNRKDSVISNRIEDNSENEDVKSLKNLEEDETDTDNYVKKASLWSVTKLNSPEWYLLLLGTLGATAMGASMPIFSIIFGNIIQVLANPDTDYVKKETNKFCLYFFYAGILSFFSTFFQMYMFGRAGQILTQRIRSKMFEALLKQEISYFDRKENGVGSLCAKLSNEAALVQGATGQRIGAIMNSLATLVLSLLLAAYYEWRLGLVALAFFPVILCVTFLQRRQMSTQTDKFKESLERSTKVAVEAVGSIRTVVSLGCEETFFNLYINELIPHIKTTLINTHGRALVLGLSRAIMPFAFSTCMYYGGHLIITNNVPYGNVFTVSQALIMGTTSIGNSLAFTPNLEKGLQAAKIIMNLINRIPKVRNSQKASNKEEAHGELKYDGVHFSYPTRDSIQILKGLNLEIIEGKTVALVGPSGCGKSTIIQLLERFYDPNSGNVFFDKNDIKEITLNSLRSHLGIVSQEPNLFSRTISENIAYGDNSRSVTEAEIIEAAKQANSHNFITQLPHGYDTKLGEKGTQLSGGQKQRIAIARALIRNPKILLLDEATSALDAESEKVVQNALDYAKQGRTCLTIAHRLTTIQDADLICVINNGIVAEQGNHKELIEKRGLYYKLHSLQHS